MLSDFITQTSEIETIKFYKEWVIRSKGSHNNYHNVEKYFQKHGKGNFQFETSWAYIQYKKWVESDVYHKDLDTIRRWFEDDIVVGFDSICEEIISMEDEDTNDYQLWINIRGEYALIQSKTEKMEFISNLYQKKLYYPLFNDIWLYDLFEDRIVSDI